MLDTGLYLLSLKYAKLFFVYLQLNNEILCCVDKYSSIVELADKEKLRMGGQGVIKRHLFNLP